MVGRLVFVNKEVPAMAETFMKPKGLGISSPHCGSYLALIGERQDTSSVRRMILQGAGAYVKKLSSRLEFLNKKKEVAAKKDGGAAGGSGGAPPTDEG